MNLDKTVKIGKYTLNLLDILAFCAMIIIGVTLRVFLFSYESQDWIEFLKGWTDVLGSRDGFKTLEYGWYNYTGIYMYILFVIVKLPIPNLIGIKIVSVIFDLALAVVVAKVCKLLKENINPLLPFAVVWFLPTVVANSAMWGQCDSIYSLFIILSFYYLLKENSFKAMLFFSISFAIKLQSIFFAPVILLMFLLKKIRFREFFLIPIVYFISIVPLWIAGRPLFECLTIYLGQAQGKVTGISQNYPNIYYLLLNDCYIDLYHAPAMLFTVSVLLFIMYYVLKACYRKGIDSNILVQTALLSTTLIVFFLPNMHDRYSYIPDILAIIYAFTVPRKFHIPVLRTLVSFIAYQTYFVYGSYFDYNILAFIGIYLIFDGTVTLINTLKAKEIKAQ